MFANICNQWVNSYVIPRGSGQQWPTMGNWPIRSSELANCRWGCHGQIGMHCNQRSNGHKTQTQALWATQERNGRLSFRTGASNLRFLGENPTCTTDCDIRCASHPGDSLEVFEKSTPRTYEVLTNDQLRINQPSSGNRVVLRIKSPKTLKNLGPYRTGWASRTAPGQKQWLLDIGDFVENIKPHEAKKMAGENVKVMKLDERSKTQVGNVRAFPVTLSTDELGMAQDIF